MLAIASVAQNATEAIATRPDHHALVMAGLSSNVSHQGLDDVANLRHWIPDIDLVIKEE